VNVVAGRHGALANWSSSGPRTTVTSLSTDDGQAWSASLLASGNGYRVRIGAQELDVQFDRTSPPVHAIRIDGLRHAAHFAQCEEGPSDEGGSGRRGWLDLGGFAAGFFDAAAQPAPSHAGTSDGKVRAGMHGRVVAVHAAAGQSVLAGQALVSIEAMKMEQRIEAPTGGWISRAHARLGEQVSPSTLLFEIEPCTPGDGRERDDRAIEATPHPMPSSGNRT
jgi:acetyl/propionyl-CoA carboxylase alpha subunit